ncbi:MAG: colicin V synthesis protein [Sulfobacillus thermosulfidooxidans]|nr:MAG: colicin V synthesis protein [Sulfobacillus thermosulfidooxidans]
MTAAAFHQDTKDLLVLKEDIGMRWVDIAILLYIAVGAVSGIRRGLITVLFSLAGYVMGIIVAAQYQAGLTQTLMASLPVTTWARRLLPGPAASVPGYTLQADDLIHTLVALLVFLVIVGAIEFLGRLLGEFLTRIVKTLKVTGFLNKVGGAAAGLAEHGVLVGLVITLLFALPIFQHSPITNDMRHDALVMALRGWFGHLAKLPGGTFL